MNDPQDFAALLNGKWIGADRLSLAVTDAGFVQGTTVAEQLRTFGGRLFRLDAHLDRLWHSLQIVGVQPPLDRRQMAQHAEELVAHNHRLMGEGDDLGLCIFVTPGPYSTFAPPGEPTVGMHTYRLPFHLWASTYTNGQSLRSTRIRQVPAACWPPELKCRSRMHYYLADREAAAAEPGARALMLDLEGHVTEASTANILAFRESEGLISPPRESILPGISMETAFELAAAAGLPVVHRTLTVDDLCDAAEVLLSSTSPCLLPVTRIDGRRIGEGSPGPLFARLMRAWGAKVGVDIVQQAERHRGTDDRG